MYARRSLALIANETRTIVCEILLFIRNTNLIPHTYFIDTSIQLMITQRFLLVRTFFNNDGD